MGTTRTKHPGPAASVALTVIPARQAKPDKDFIREEMGDSIPQSTQTHFLDLLPKFFQERVAAIPQEFWEMDERELREKLYDNAKVEIDQTTALLRLNLWEEYDRCFKHKLKAIDIARVIHGVCTIAFLRKKSFEKDARVALLCTPPPYYESTLRELHTLALSQYRDILLLPNVLENGETDARLIAVKEKIGMFIDMRLKGAIIQRIDQRNVNVNFDVPMEGAAPANLAELSMDDCDRRLAELEAESHKLSTPTIIEAEIIPSKTDVEKETVGLGKPGRGTPQQEHQKK